MGEKLLISRQIYVGYRCYKQTAVHIAGQLQSRWLVPSGVQQLLTGAYSYWQVLKLLSTDQQTSSNRSKKHSYRTKEKAKGKHEPCLFSNKIGNVL